MNVRRWNWEEKTEIYFIPQAAAKIFIDILSHYTILELNLITLAFDHSINYLNN